MMWERDTSGECPDEDEGSATVPGDTTSYDIMGLAGISSYAITVTASNAVGSAVSEPVSEMTGEIGESSHVAVFHKMFVTIICLFSTFSSISPSHINWQI